jgi:hypothetical protein
MHSTDRSELTAAAHSIDDRLGRDPDNPGESRDGGIRILLSPPLGVKFSVSADDRTVLVTDVWSFENRRKQR